MKPRKAQQLIPPAGSCPHGGSQASALRLPLVSLYVGAPQHLVSLMRQTLLLTWSLFMPLPPPRGWSCWSDSILLDAPWTAHFHAILRLAVELGEVGSHYASSRAPSL